MMMIMATTMMMLEMAMMITTTTMTMLEIEMAIMPKTEEHLVEGGLQGSCSGLATAVHLQLLFNQDPRDYDDYLLLRW